MINPVLERIQQANFQDLPGTQLHCSVPLTRALLNWNIQRSLPDKIESVQIKSIQGRIVELQVETTIPLLPVFDITVELYENLSPPRLELKMTILDGLGWMARKALDMVLPDGMDLDDKVLTVDLYHFLLEKTKYRSLANKITFARWVAAKDKLLLEFELQF